MILEERPQNEANGNTNEEKNKEIREQDQSILSKKSSDIRELTDLEKNGNYIKEGLEKISEENKVTLTYNTNNTSETIELQSNGNSREEKKENIKQRSQRILSKESSETNGNTEPEEKVKSNWKNIEKIRIENQGSLSKNPTDISEYTELQCCNCTSRIIDKSIRCRACIVKQTDVCRFKFTRFFKKGKIGKSYGNVFIKIEEAEKYLKNIDLGRTGPGKRSETVDNFIIPEIECAPINSYDKGNEIENTKYIEKYLSPSLVCSYSRELNFLNDNREDLRYRPMIAPVNQHCDRCKTGISCFYYLCQRCGTEICLDCYDNFEEEIDIRFNPLQCRKKDGLFHLKEMFLPYSNFTLKSLDNIFSSINFNDKELTIPFENLDKDDLYLPEGSIESHEYPHGPLSQFPIEKFQMAWQKGIPMVIKLDSSKALHTCNPEFFIKYYGEADINVLRLDNQPGMNMKVRDFFEGFINKKGGLLDEDGNQIPIKIKDWPSTLSFKEYFKCLYNDFMNVLPYPTYMRYDGPFNLISHLPNTTIIPDLGPKMYNSYPNTEYDTIFGTTPLHCDAADAINKMEYCSDGDNSIGAIWDIFRREDIDVIRKFIFKKFNGIAIFDPIHDQNYYLNDTLLDELYKEYKVKSYRIYQKVGDAVLIPAGCAHQVRNIHHCIKIAMDFVAPESISICAKLTSEFRKLPYRHGRCIDIISTKALMLNVWNKVNKIINGKALFGPEEVLTYKNKANKSDNDSRLTASKRNVTIKEGIEEEQPIKRRSNRVQTKDRVNYKDF